MQYRKTVESLLPEPATPERFEECLWNAWDAVTNNGGNLALLVLHVREFENIVGSVGEAVANEIVSSVVNRIRPIYGAGDGLGRFGSDRLAILLRNTDGAVAKSVAMQLCTAIEDREFVHCGVGTIGITVSVGVEAYPEGATRRRELIEHAEVAMHAAKWAGPNRVVLYGETWLARLERSPSELVANLTRSLDCTQVLIDVLDVKMPGLARNCRRVERLAVRMGEYLGLDEYQRGDLRWAARIRDLALLYVPSDILSRRAVFSEEAERITIVRHAEHGAELIAEVPSLARIAAVVRHHHESFNGCGYPDRLKGTSIPYLARILTVADAFVSGIPENPADITRSRQNALWKVRSQAGSQFDPAIVGALIKVYASDAANIPNTSNIPYRWS